MSKPSKLLLFDGSQEVFLVANKGCCHVSDILVVLILYVGDREQSLLTHVFKNRILPSV
ncbi:hypothetical protein DPMN_188767 [Dreissena polymorpha]|uniref:Uncharacterized protein n=1 Tax=Dreissena polymorpha TaxID=45954 RepID=A0A9D4I8U6_DREPO|nr:hypothetical protein DPMN_188707 [Dreissena polymorpha]KAH3754106.1 hypothetical protein DPMN_188767 [Dreissena polymorpha]